jgi:hypothetical protein
VNSRSTAGLREKLRDKNLTWDQRQAIMRELADRFKEENPQAAVRMETLYRHFQEGKLTLAEGQEMARYFGIPMEDIYKRPPNFKNPNSEGRGGKSYI